MVEFVKTIKVGDGMQEGNFLGPIQNSMQYEKVKGFFSDIEKSGQKVAVGGVNEDKPGYFITPTLIDRPNEDSKLVQEEPFGPIVPVMTWNDESEVIARANNTRMGLGASVWATDLDRANNIAKQLKAGSVWVKYVSECIVESFANRSTALILNLIQEHHSVVTRNLGLVSNGHKLVSRHIAMLKLFTLRRRLEIVYENNLKRLKLILVVVPDVCTVISCLSIADDSTRRVPCFG